VTGTTYTVTASDNLQTAINNASLGDEIVIDAGTTWTGPITLPDKGAGSDFILIRSANLSSLTAGVRVGPSDASNMAKIEAGNSTNEYAIACATNAHHYWFAGIEICQNVGVATYNLIDQNIDNHHMRYDRCYIHADDAYTHYCVRGGNFSGVNIAVFDSYLYGFWANGQDTQAFWATKGDTFLIHNCQLTAAGESIMFGGTNGYAEDEMPSDITITKNYFFKPLSWQHGMPTWDGVTRTQKNHLELKLGIRVLIECNDFINWWLGDAGQRYAIVFKSTNQGPAKTEPYAVTKHITFRYNYLQGLGGGIQFATTGGSTPTSDALVEHNLLVDMALSQDWSQPGRSEPSVPRIIQILHIHPNVTIRNNTAFMKRANDSTGLWVDTGPQTNFKFNDNILSQGVYGILGSSRAANTVLTELLPTAEFKNNIFIDGPLSSLVSPAENTSFPASIAAVGFENYIEAGGGDYSLAAGSAYKGAGSDGNDPGVNFTLYNAARA
jgi:hypothetical protein